METRELMRMMRGIRSQDCNEVRGPRRPSVTGEGEGMKTPENGRRPWGWTGLLVFAAACATPQEGGSFEPTGELQDDPSVLSPLLIAEPLLRRHKVS